MPDAHSTWSVEVAAALLALVALVSVTLWGKMSVIAVLVAAAFYQAPITSVGRFPGITLAEFAAFDFNHLLEFTPGGAT